MPRSFFPTASTGFHPAVAPLTRELRACFGPFAPAVPYRARPPSEPCNPGLRYGLPEYSARSPDSFPATSHDARLRPIAAAGENADSKAVEKLVLGRRSR